MRHLLRARCQAVAVTISQVSGCQSRDWCCMHTPTGSGASVSLRGSHHLPAVAIITCLRLKCSLHVHVRSPSPSPSPSPR